MKKYIKKNSVSNFKRSDTNGMKWEPFQRFTKLYDLKNKHINFF
ncbi:phage protein [Staphylococcus aureus]|nr:phage protein [Staphylococcus aureus]